MSAAKAVRRLTLGAAALAGLVGVWLLFRGSQRSEDSVEPPVRDAAPPAAPAEALVADAQALAAPDAAALGERLPAEVESEEQASDLPERGALVVRVVDKDGRAEAGVPVAIFGVVNPVGVAMPMEKATTDAAGSALLGSKIRVDDDDLMPSAHFYAGIDLPLEPPVRVDLGPKPPQPTDPTRTVELVLPAGARAWLQPLRVQVVDAGGAPVAGARVVFQARIVSEPDSTQRLGEETTAAPDGVASFSRERVHNLMTYASVAQVRFEYEVALEGPFVPEPRAAVPLEPSSELVRLKLPPTGSVAVTVRAADGTPVAAGAHLSFEWYPTGESKRAGQQAAEVVSSVTRFERIGLGLDLSLKARLEGGSAESQPVVIAGPARAGEEIAVELKLDPPKPVLTGTVVDADGRPRAEMRFFLSLHPLDASRDRSRASRSSLVFDTTDAEGRFKIPWGHPLPAEPTLLRATEQYPRSGPPPGWIPHVAEAAFPPLEQSRNELPAGVLVLREIPVIVAGRVADQSGKPVVQARVSASYPAGEEGDQWHNLNVVSTTGSSILSTDAEGRFAIRSLEPLRALRLIASSKDAVSAEKIVAPGTFDVELVLEPAEDMAKTRGEIAGTVRFDEDIPLTDVEVVIFGGPDGRSDTYPFGGGFRFQDLRPGTYDLIVATRETDFELFKLEGIEVRAGERTRDARLTGIDLRGRLRWLKLLLRGEDGQPLVEHRVWTRAGVRWGGPSETDEQGRIALLVPTEHVSFEIQADGCANASVGWSADEQVVALQRREKQ